MDTTATFRHEAFLYAGAAEFLDGTLGFIRASVAAGEPILVIVSAAKIDMLRSELDDDAGSVLFADMAAVGGNPARIIPAWRQFVTEHGGRGRTPRGVGEPVWSGRSAAELAECQRHESLLNVAFDGSPSWWLLCPYDTGTLDTAVIGEAIRSHPFVMRVGEHRTSDGYRGLDASAAPFDAPLPEPPGDAAALAFDAMTLRDLRAFVAGHATSAGLSAEQAEHLVLAAHEVAANSLHHGGGQGTLRVWREPGAVVCEVHDQGQLRLPLAGRERPTADQASGHGLWLVNHLCDLVQLRSFRSGTVVRLHARLQPD